MSSSADDKSVNRSRIHKFQQSHRLYVILLISLAALQFIAIAFFCKGFLLSRNVLSNVGQMPYDHHDLTPEFRKVVILVVDALRFDFVVPVSESDPNYNANYHNNIESLYEEFQNRGTRDSSSLLLKFMADPPTTTLQRLKGLTTGSLPTFIDAGSNFDGDVIEEDNLIKQFFLTGKKVYFAGDDTWDALFHPFLSNMSRPYESLNVWDLDTVDYGVRDFFETYLLNDKTKHNEWDILVGHMLGVDHVGHKYGPNHFTMRDKQTQVNNFIEQIINAIDRDTLLVVMGDHGMDHTGNHGGDSPDELQSTLFLYSKRKNAWSYMDDEFYDVHDAGKNYRTVNQIDLVPTLSLLMGQPIPFNNLGWPIYEVAKHDQQRLLFNEITLKQLRLYKDTIGLPLHPDKEEELESLWMRANEDPDYAPILQAHLLELFKDRWARFDYLSIGTGIILLTISLILLLLITKFIPSIIVNQMVPEFVPWIGLMTLISNACFHGIFYVFQQPEFVNNILWCSLLATSIGIIAGCCIPIFDRYSIQWLFVKFCESLYDYWSRVACTIVIIHALLFTSNSFTIWEDRIVAVLLSGFGMLALYEFVFVPKRQSTTALLTAAISETQGTTSGVNQATANSNSLPLTRFARLLGGYHSLSLIICTRLASAVTICREEQGNKCTPTFTTSNNNSWWILGICFFLIFMLPSCIQGYYNLSSSYQAAAPIWINVFLKGILGANWIYWTLTSVENSLENEWAIDIPMIKFTLARIIAGFALVAANVGWLMGPLCIKLNLSDADLNSHQATILGYTNIYGSEYFLFVINAFMAIILFNKPMAQISLFFMVNQILSVLEIIDLLKLKENIIGPVVLGLLSYQQFFSTGHQATIPSIQWDTGFILSDTITFPFTHLAIVLNTFGSQILVALSVALLTLWSQPPNVLKPQTLLGRVVSNCGMLLVYQTVLCLSSFVWVTHFRRHLMVWKIFCPRFMLAALSLIVTQLVVTFGTIAFATGRLVKHINDIFWK